jgi:hypothetical protein
MIVMGSRLRGNGVADRLRTLRSISGARYFAPLTRYRKAAFGRCGDPEFFLRFQPYIMASALAMTPPLS